MSYRARELFTATGLRVAAWRDEWRAPRSRGSVRGVATSDGYGRTRAPARKRRRVAIVVMLVCLLGTGGFGGLQVVQTLDVARSGMQHFKNAQTAFTVISSHPFDTATIARAHDEFAAAERDFRALQQRLSQYPSALAMVPGPGSQFGAATRLAPVAIEGAQLGMIGCDTLSLLATRLKDPLNPQGQGLTSPDLATISENFARIKALFATISRQVAQLQPGDERVTPQIERLLGSLRPKLPEMGQLLDEIETVLPLLPTLLGVGEPAHYLLQVMDSTELRPAGGFIGNYGILTLTGGRLGAIAVQDVDLLDAPYKYGSKRIPVPPVYQWFAQLIDHWAFRDSNLDADFPTAARYGEQLYAQEGGTTPVAGVVAITPWLIRDALKITGPISLAPDYQETITPDNLIERIHFHQLGAGAGPDNVIDPVTGTSLRKRFMGILFQHFMATIKKQSATDMSPLIRLFGEAVRHKDLQIYLNADQAEKALQAHHLGATIEAPVRGDSFFAVDANISANKSNGVLQYQMSEAVTLDATGNAAHTTTLAYTWPKDPKTLTQTYPYPTSLPNVLHTYQRIYLPPAATITGTSGWGDLGKGTAFNRQVFSGDFRTWFATTYSVTINWTTKTVATHDAAGWHYRYLLQRQAGVTFNLALSVRLPDCAKLAAPLPAGFTMQDAHTLSMKQPFQSDLPLAIDYTC
jgi:Protein of unknown function (DUF4012)